MGIGPATLMRVENGRLPDLTTFGKICNWLDIEPGSFLGFERRESSAAPPQADHPTPVLVAAHFRAEQTPQPETIQALAQMILLAIKNQPSINTVKSAEPVGSRC
jgi:transcriptional regulator with XRE-family HTH domain